ncbi:MAG: hypothetical protein V4864_01285 [Pseudomonadota bacterium]
MKKTLIVSALALAALGGTGAAFADAECQAGSAYGYKPGCGGPSDSYGSIPDPRYGDPHAPQHDNSRYPWRNGRYDRDGRYYGPQAAVVTPRYAPTRRDRDGDGVPNARDRWPDNSRRW